MSSNDSTAKEQSFLFNVNKIFLVIHLLMLFMFSSLGVDLMAGVSLISICFYFQYLHKTVLYFILSLNTSLV
jgi:hypothetical protein